MTCIGIKLDIAEAGSGMCGQEFVVVGEYALDQLKSKSLVKVLEL
jgi:hypothetical protein